ncbi:flagellar hook-associated family protein [Pseudochelatococcus lubricantis]|uniref:flagellar hook-associated family protein n=1 Tax=Pseudochelatococcus lubricantis TaxID=1538102 RepID=UPI0035EFA3B1
MSANFVSTYNLLNGPRLYARNAQAEIARLGKEIVTERHADVGLVLGAKTGHAAILHQEAGRIGTLMISNGVAAGRLDVTQAVITELRETADSMLSTLTGLPTNSLGSATIEGEAGRNLAALIDKLNASFAGARLFGGIKTDTAPMKNGADTVAVAFDGYVTGLSAPVSGVTAAQFETFLSSAAFSGLFTAAGWETNWSAASDTNISTRISATETIETSVNANARAFQQLTQAYAVLGALPSSGLNESAFKTAVSHAIAQLGEAVNGLTIMQADLGGAQTRIKTVNERLKTQETLVTENLRSLEGVDATEAKVASDAFELQLNLSYALTARLQNLSLLKYL